jgi:hypothetical protein
VNPYQREKLRSIAELFLFLPKKRMRHLSFCLLLISALAYGQQNFPNKSSLDLKEIMKGK